MHNNYGGFHRNSKNQMIEDKGLFADSCICGQLKDVAYQTGEFVKLHR